MIYKVIELVEREVGGAIGMGNTCKSMASSLQCMTKPTTIKKKIITNKVQIGRKEIKIKHKIFQLIKTKHYKSPFF